MSLFCVYWFRFKSHRVKSAKVCSITQALTFHHDIRFLRDDGMEAATVTVKEEGRAPLLKYHFHQCHEDKSRLHLSHSYCQITGKHFSVAAICASVFHSVYSNGFLIGYHLQNINVAVSGTKRLPDTISVLWCHGVAWHLWLPFRFSTVTWILKVKNHLSNKGNG